MKLKRELGSIDAMDVSTDLPRSKRHKRGSSAPAGNSADVDMKDANGEETTPKEDRALVKEQGFNIYNAVVNAKGEQDRVLSYDFQHLPSKRMYADYYTLITEPVALDGIKSKLNRGVYSSLKSVKHDFDTCFKNAKKYNMKDSQIWRDAKELHKIASNEYRSIVGSADVDILGSESDESEDENDEDGDYDGGKTKSPKGRRGRPISIIRLMRLRMQKLVEKTDDDGRLITEAFMELPDKKTYPMYYKTIKRLMCFDLILKRIKRKEYSTMAQFAADVELVFSNALSFNEEHSLIWEDAMTLKNYFRVIMSDLPPQFSLPEYSSNTKPVIQNGKLKLRVPAPSQVHTPAAATESLPNGAGTSLKVKLPPLASANVPIAPAVTTPVAIQPSPSVPITRQQAATKTTQPPNIAPQPPAAQIPTVQAPTATYLQPMTYPQLPPHQPQPQYQYHPNISVPQSTVNSISPSPLSTTPVPPHAVYDHPLRSIILKTLPLGRTLRLDASEGVRTWVLRLSKDENKLAVREIRFLDEDESDEEMDEEESKSAQTGNSGKGEVFVKANGVLVNAQIPNTKEGEGVWEVSELKPGANVLEVGEQSGEVWKVVLQRPLVKT